ncbi:hypothetical protein [Niveispirillum cyanobacteriorum]|nr:hypothetical protein [Niveispirillum cyanobacteriorum]
METEHRQHRHVVLLGLDPHHQGWRMEDRRAIATLIASLTHDEPAYAPGQMETWLHWRQARPDLGWVSLKDRRPMFMARRSGAGDRQLCLLHIWTIDDPPDEDCEHRAVLGQRLALADAVVVLVPARVLLDQQSGGSGGWIEALETLARDIQGGAALFLCLTGAEALLSLLDPSPAVVAAHLPTPAARSRWLERCARFDRLVGLKARFRAVHSLMIASQDFDGLTDLSTWTSWAIKEESLHVGGSAT